MKIVGTVREVGSASWTNKKTGEIVTVPTVTFEFSAPMVLQTIQANPKSQMGLGDVYRVLIGRTVLAPLENRTFRGASGEFAKWSFSGDGKPQLFAPQSVAEAKVA